MHFITGHVSLADAVTKSNELALLLGSALDFMTAEEISQLVNFIVGGGTAAGGSNSDGRTPCVVATAAYGTPMEGQIDVLREVRDTYLLNTVAGSAFVDAYYTLSPPVADFVAKHPAAATMVRVLLTPIIAIASALWTLPLLAGAFVMTVSYALRRRKLSLTKASS